MYAVSVYQQAQVAQEEPITGTIFEQFINEIEDRARRKDPEHRISATANTYKHNIMQFAYYIQDNGIDRPTGKDLQNYVDELSARGLKASTIAGYLSAVKVFLKWTAANGIYPDISGGVHGPAVDRKSHKKDAFTAAEVYDIEQSINRNAAAKVETAAEAEKDTAGRIERATEQGLRTRAIYALAVNAGLRTVEISRANVKDIEIKSGQTYIYIWGKGHAEADQKKALAPEVAKAIQDYLDSRADHYTGSSPLFVSTGNRSGGKRIAATTIGQMLKKAMKEAGYNSERLTAHSLRHTAGTAAYMITGDIYQVQTYMRHADPKTTEIYVHDINLTGRDAQTAERLYQYYHTVEAEAAAV